MLDVGLIKKKVATTWKIDKEILSPVQD